jgi:hypothetical protein
MLNLIKRVVDLVRQEPSLVVEEDSALTLKLRQGHRVTTFDRLSRTVVQNGRLVARFGVIQHVRVARAGGPDAPEQWSLALDLSGGAQVEVARSPDGNAAAAAASRIATLTGVPCVRPPA